MEVTAQEPYITLDCCPCIHFDNDLSFSYSIYWDPTRPVGAVCDQNFSKFFVSHVEASGRTPGCSKGVNEFIKD
jgi:hypothetical protein